MASKAFPSVKVKVTASLDAGLIKAIDEFLKESKTRSRSQLIEEALFIWYKEQKKQELELPENFSIEVGGEVEDIEQSYREYFLGLFLPSY